MKKELELNVSEIKAITHKSLKVNEVLGAGKKFGIKLGIRKLNLVVPDGKVCDVTIPLSIEEKA